MAASQFDQPHTYLDPLAVNPLWPVRPDANCHFCSKPKGHDVHDVSAETAAGARALMALWPGWLKEGGGIWPQQDAETAVGLVVAAMLEAHAAANPDPDETIHVPTLGPDDDPGAVLDRLRTEADEALREHGRRAEERLIQQMRQPGA